MTLSFNVEAGMCDCLLHIMLPGGCTRKEHANITAYLDGKQVACAVLAREVHAAKCATADGLEDLKLVDAHALLQGERSRQSRRRKNDHVAGRCVRGQIWLGFTLASTAANSHQVH